MQDIADWFRVPAQETGIDPTIFCDEHDAERMLRGIPNTFWLSLVRRSTR